MCAHVQGRRSTPPPLPPTKRAKHVSPVNPVLRANPVPTHTCADAFVDAQW